MGHVIDRVRARFPDAEPEHIRRIVEQVHHEYDGRPIREFVPVLVEREVVNTLRFSRTRRTDETSSVSSKELLNL